METKQFYDQAKYYDIAFTSKGFNRDVAEETDFYLDCFKKYSRLQVKSILEVACGTGTFITSFAKRGYRVTAYDLSDGMVKYAKELVQKEGCGDKAEVLQGDMRVMKFNKKYDASLNLLSSICYCVSDEEVLQHFSNMAQTLRKGAAYILEFSYACNDIKNENPQDQSWAAEQDGIKIAVSWNPDRYDEEHKIRHVTVSMQVDDHGKTFSFSEDHNLRLWHYHDFVRLTSLAGFRLRAIYNNQTFALCSKKNVVGEDGTFYHVLVKE